MNFTNLFGLGLTMVGAKSIANFLNSLGGSQQNFPPIWKDEFGYLYWDAACTNRIKIYRSPWQYPFWDQWHQVPVSKEWMRYLNSLGGKF